MTTTPAAERLESLKAGLIGGAIATITFSLVLTCRHPLYDSIAKFLRQGLEKSFSLTPLELSETLISLDGLLSLAIATFAGFLFGVTYRYTVRQDDNLQLKTGAMLAFGLVRGLAQIDVGFSSGLSLLSLAMLGLENLLLFAIAAFGLDWSMHQGIIQPFGASLSAEKHQAVNQGEHQSRNR